MAFIVIGTHPKPPSHSSLLIETADHSFFAHQLKYPRFRQALANREDQIKTLLAEKKWSKHMGQVYLRAFKQEKQLELWVKPPAAKTFIWLKTYAVCRLSGVMGPKRVQGDRQIPEGFYFIDRFNPASNYHLSLGINYPNQSDRILGDPEDPGDNIFIHGNCVTIGCLPLTDRWIEELYVICVAARSNGQKHIPVHIFPTKMTAEQLNTLGPSDSDRQAFWSNLQEGYRYFETHLVPPKIHINRQGRYQFTGH